MTPATGATPLIALHAAAIDTETTGLDTARDRIVQIGAVALAGDGEIEGASLDLLVDPGIPIPKASSKIHGITDAMVQGAPEFGEAADRLKEYIAGRIVIGHSIGFDLAVLEHESQRSGKTWQKPRSLCVRLLAAVLRPGLPDLSLESIATWLGITIAGRHSALGDAQAAANIFVALVPRLHQRGIRTLAEAEIACLALRTELESGDRAGWVEPVSRPASPAFRMVDPFAYRNRVCDVMGYPPIVVPSAALARGVVVEMVAHGISTVFVSETGKQGQPLTDYGIVTERDVMRRLAARGGSVLDEPVGDFASRPLVSIHAAAFVYRAIGRMDRLNIRHLAVRDEQGRLAGIVSVRDLLKLRASAAINLDDALEGAETPAALAATWATLPAVARALVVEEIDARIIAEIVSEELCAVTRRVAILAEREMLAEGRGAPPCPYVLLVLGSGGRGESLLAADQDNAIVFSEGDPGEDNDQWFAELGGKIAYSLDMVGVPYCKGGVMAKTPEFRGSLAVWKARVGEWVRRSRPQDLLNVDIFFDLRAVHGDTALADELYDHACDLGHAEPGFAKMLGESIVRGEPFTLLGGFRHEDGRIDLKKYGLFPIVAAARTLAIRHGVRARSTKARLHGLLELGIGGDADILSWLTGHSFLLSLMLTQQTTDLNEGIPVSNKIETGKLDPAAYARLKSVLKTLQHVPDVVRSLMFATPRPETSISR